MEIKIDGSAQSEPISLDYQSKDFKVGVHGVVSADAVGKWSIQYSPNGNDWFDHEDLNSVTGNKSGNFYFNVPYMRIVSALTVGSVTVYLYGSVQ